MGTINADFSGETAVVTGASSGIGRAVANGFGDAGATVINADVRAAPKDLDAEAPTHEAIEDRGGTAVFVETDVSDPTQIESVIEAAGEFGGVDVMVNNAGVHRSAEFLDVTPEDFDFVHGVNLKGAFFGTQLAAQDMIDRGVEGTIVNTSSTTAERAEWNHSHYAATKGGIQMLTRSAALELDRHGIRVNAVAPGPIATEIREGWSEEARDTVGESGDLPSRAGTPADLRDAYLYLASEGASYVTGETVWVDGGSSL
ncbi:SDR family NAD(P)-dependent oxidoreductase [Halorubrum lacusprofundi]|jgi:NAD(P)-dependent dehydrogenase (short-subunit alcohol dehydrogenase family)|uniref:Short-chain dehydrogenase/reductase SDR n=1 Tax=Halorubrum lacusprofundi (strain ATCC 49239 / DSM 5036 / JCM 8891 / ACAM 34) TaxID=416348 RepID=B9LMN1_HALLT|nr:SDR family NAD(P)-dependent oxidoreductase [Halorubrum lacusprofundi]ACM56619.1 short-chain dehydrogenase/reductase SDR [Halorubrum lacusprofundi ATCC 49239]MCG1005115.1 SDR family oxidoreductase [Halorubrum lacusprofundi]